jgi:hypothetical protein
LMKCVECEKNETIDKNFVFLNVAVKLHWLSWDLYYVCMYCTVITFSTIKTKFHILCSLTSVCYMLEAVIYVKLFFQFSSFMSGSHSFHFLTMAIAFLLPCLIFCCHIIFCILLFPNVRNKY